MALLSPSKFYNICQMVLNKNSNSTTFLVHNLTERSPIELNGSRNNAAFDLEIVGWFRGLNTEQNGYIQQRTSSTILEETKREIDIVVMSSSTNDTNQ